MIELALCHMLRETWAEPYMRANDERELIGIGRADEVFRLEKPIARMMCVEGFGVRLIGIADSLFNE